MLCWEGAGLFAPERWEIGRHSGDAAKGFFRIDNDHRFVLQLRWWTATKPVPIARLVEQHAREVAGRRDAQLPRFQKTNDFRLPQGSHDRASAFISKPSGDAPADSSELLVIWQRSSVARVMMIRFMIEHGQPDPICLKSMLSGLRLQGPQETRDWAFHDLAFQTPPDWHLQLAHLYAGVAYLEFKHRRDRFAIRRFSVADAVMGTTTPAIEDLTRWCRVVYAKEFFDMRYRIELMTDPAGRPGLRLSGSRRWLAPIEMRWLLPRHRRLPRRIDIIWDAAANKIYNLEIRRPSLAMEPILGTVQKSLRLNLADVTAKVCQDEPPNGTVPPRARSLNARVRRRKEVYSEINNQGRTVLTYTFPRPRRLRGLRLLAGLDSGPQKIKRKLELDLIGSLVWERCDRSPKVRQLIADVRQRFLISYREAELSVTEFIRAMGSRGLLSVHIDAPS